MSHRHHTEGENLHRIESYQWPTAHISHLSQGQQQALDKFKQLCEQKGYFTPGDAQTPPTHDDETLLRYLRARKFIPRDAFVQFKDTEDWRAENELDELYETIDIHEYDGTRRLYPQWTGRRDKRGIPLYVFEIAQIDAKAVAAQDHGEKHHKTQSTTGKTSHRMLRLFALYENLCRFVLPLCSAIPNRPHAETPISQSNNIVDMSKVGFAKLWSLRGHMSDASTLATAHYPETLDRIFVVGAPSFFPTVWEWAKRWFDPITVSKIFILTEKNITATLSKYVDLDNIPKKYGGNLDWEFGDMPFLEDDIANALRWHEPIEYKGHKTLPIGPIRLQYDEAGDVMVTAIGTQNGKPRNNVIAGLHPEAGVARLAFSPGRIGPPRMNGKATSNHTAPTTNGVTKTNTMTSNGTTSSTADTPVLTVSGTPNDVVPTTREGTSSTRFEQQDGTHAADQLASGTPEKRVDGQGTSHAVMEPNTVGQAPKEHPIPNQDVTEPTVIEKAQQVAGQAYDTVAQVPQQVMSAVGLGEKTTAMPMAAQQTRSADAEVEHVDSKTVEEFLRHKTMSTAQSV